MMLGATLASYMWHTLRPNTETLEPRSSGLFRNCSSGSRHKRVKVYHWNPEQYGCGVCFSWSFQLLQWKKESVQSFCVCSAFCSPQLNIISPPPAALVANHLLSPLNNKWPEPRSLKVRPNKMLRSIWEFIDCPWENSLFLRQVVQVGNEGFNNL